MHIVGKIFVVLNLSLTFVFLVYSADIVKFRRDMLEGIKAQKEKIPKLDQRIRELAAEKRELQQKIARTEAEIEAQINVGSIKVSELEAMIAVNTDSRNDRKDGGLRVAEGVMEKLQGQQGRLKFFRSEIDVLDREIAQLNDEDRVLVEEVSSLEERLAETKKKFENAKREIYENYEILRKRVNESEQDDSDDLARLFGNH